MVICSTFGHKPKYFVHLKVELGNSGRKWNMRCQRDGDKRPIKSNKWPKWDQIIEQPRPKFISRTEISYNLGNCM